MTTTERSLGRAVALTALAPIAERLAEQHERTERDEARRRQLEDELAELPSLERPKAPGAWTPWWRTSELGEVLLGLLMIGIPVVVVVTGIFALALGSTPAVLVLGVLCGSAIVLARTVKTTLDEMRQGRQVAEAQAGYAVAIREFDDREKERIAIQAKIEEISR